MCALKVVSKMQKELDLPYQFMMLILVGLVESQLDYRNTLLLVNENIIVKDWITGLPIHDIDSGRFG